MSQTLCHLCIAHGTVRRASACILQIHGIFPSFSPEGMLGLTGLEESHHRVSDSSTAFLCNWHCSRSTSTSLQTGVSVLPTVKELVKGLSVTTEQGQKASIPLPFLSTCLMILEYIFSSPFFTLGKCKTCQDSLISTGNSWNLNEPEISMFRQLEEWKSQF